jgi:hypothetical protein
MNAIYTTDNVTVEKVVLAGGQYHYTIRTQTRTLTIDVDEDVDEKVVELGYFISQREALLRNNDGSERIRYYLR